MSSLDELKDALRETLAARGSLGQIQARVRAEIFNALEETEDPKPPPSHENLIINELIREYLEYNHYKHTLSVMMPETGQHPERLNRNFLAQELGVSEDNNSRQIPLLYGVVARLQQERKAAPRMAPANIPKGNVAVEMPGASRVRSPNRAGTENQTPQRGAGPPQDAGAARRERSEGSAAIDVRGSMAPAPFVLERDN